MNSGVISSRYANALLKFAESTGKGDLVLKQVEKLLDAFNNVPNLRRVVEDSISISPKQRVELLEITLDEKLSDELSRFIKLVEKNERLEYLAFIFKGFVSRYCEANNIRSISVVTSQPIEDLDVKFEELSNLVCQLDAQANSQYGSKLDIESVEKSDVKYKIEERIDPKILGGFIFTIGDYMLDASVAGQLKSIKDQFIEKNRRIV